MARPYGGAARPLLAGDDVPARVGRLLSGRCDADGRFRQVDTDRRTPDEVAAEIIELLATRLEHGDG
jgi:hypothetical protein